MAKRRPLSEKPHDIFERYHTPGTSDKRYAVEVLHPNGSWRLLSIVYLEPDEAVQAVVRVRAAPR